MPERLSTARTPTARINRDPFRASEEEYRVRQFPPGVEEASASGIIGASGTPLSSEVDGRTPPVPPGAAPAACELCLTHASTRVEPNKKADRQLKKDQTPMSTEVQPQANTAARFADPTQGDRETIGTSAAYMSNSAFHSIK